MANYKRIKMGELAFTYIGQIFGLLTVSNNCTRILKIWSGEAFFNSMYIIKIYKNLNWKESKILYYMQFVCVKITNQCILHIRQLILFLWCISMDRIGNFVTRYIQTFGKHPYFFFFFSSSSSFFLRTFGGVSIEKSKLASSDTLNMYMY